MVSACTMCLGSKNTCKEHNAICCECADKIGHATAVKITIALETKKNPTPVNPEWGEVCP